MTENKLNLILALVFDIMSVNLELQCTAGQVSSQCYTTLSNISFHSIFSPRISANEYVFYITHFTASLHI